jgi:ATP-dependent Clp protease ATP-binding subunit ClpB
LPAKYSHRRRRLPLRRFISREVETRIGRALPAGDVLDGALIRIGYADGELAVSYENQD